MVDRKLEFSIALGAARAMLKQKPDMKAGELAASSEELSKAHEAAGRLRDALTHSFLALAYRAIESGAFEP